jgi:starch synthase
MRFRLGRVPFTFRSRRAGALVRTHTVDAIIQIGATFRPPSTAGIPWFLYCDSNIRMSQAGRASGQSEAALLTQRTVEAIAQREASVYRAADAVFTLSERVRRSFLDDFGLESNRVHTVHGGPNFDPAIFDVPRAPRPSSQPPTILFVGRAFERKGGDLLLAAFERVRSQLHDARLHIVGPPRALRTQPGVVWEGFLNGDVPADRDRLIKAYTGADVFCLPTRFEPFGIVFLEAMYAGLPCIGTDVWAVPEMIVHGETGWLVPAGDERALADRLVATLRDTTLARRMGEAGRARAKRHFSWPVAVGRILDVVTPAVVNRRPTGPTT